MLGPSGCGKTTILNMIAGFTPVSGGAIRIDGRDVAEVPAYRRNIGVVFQNYALFPHLTVAENVAFGLKMRRVSRAKAEPKVKDALALVRLDHLHLRYPHELSGGQQQRAAIARAVAFSPEILLLDEPLSNLDAKLRDEMRTDLLGILEELSITTILVTHDQAEALALADRIAVLDAGKLEQIGSPVEVYEQPATPFVARFLGESNQFAGHAEADGCTVDLGGTKLHSNRLPPAILPGNPVEVFIRAQRLQINPVRQTGANSLQGHVRHIIYLGNDQRLVVDTAIGGDPRRAIGSAGWGLDPGRRRGGARLRRRRCHRVVSLVIRLRAGAGRVALYAPLTLFFLGLVVFPLGLMLSSAFQRVDTMTYEVTDHLTLYQFVRFFTDKFYLGILVETFDISLRTTALAVLIGYPYALYMWRASRMERQVLRLIALSPLLISLVIMNFGWLIVLAPTGIVNRLLMATGITSAALPLLYTKGAVILGLAHVHLPFVILSVENALETIRPELLSAGSSLGAGPWRLFRHVVLPLSVQGAVTGAVIVFALTSSAFVTPALLGGSWVKTLASVAYSQIMVTLDTPFGSAMALILLVFTGLMTVGLTRVAILFQPHLAARPPARGGLSPCCGAWPISGPASSCCRRWRSWPRRCRRCGM